MDNNNVQLVGGPCGQHGPYTFYRAFKYAKNGIKRIVTLSEFFFVKMWRDSDLLCIGELQLLWIDKNSEQVLASLRLYFLPENTPEGRMDHGEDEVLAISEKVVIRVEDLITWITEEAEWSWGRLAKCEKDLEAPPDLRDSECAPPRKPTGTSYTLTESTLDFSDVEVERMSTETYRNEKTPQVIILSYPKYCRYRAMMKRLEGVENLYLKHKIVNALGGFYVSHPNTRVLFCKETFDYPELEGHELLCNHLAPKLKGRPRGKRKKRSVSPGSESNESESSVNCYNTRSESRNGLRCESNIATRRSTRCHENNENKEFVRRLTSFMKSNRTPIGRIPSLGYKELNLYEFFTKVQKLGGYDCVTTNRLWKSIFDDMSGHQNSTSAATVIRRHYERFLLPYERYVNGEEYKPLPVYERRRLQSKRGSSSLSDADSSSGDATPTPSTSRKTSTSDTSSENKDNLKNEGKPSSLRSVRVKSERQKDRQFQSENATVQNNNNIVQESLTKSESNFCGSEDEKPTIGGLIKEEDEEDSSTDNEPLFNKIMPEPELEPEPEPIPKCDSPEPEPKKDPPLVETMEISNIKVDTNIYEKDAEPLTTAVTPSTQRISPDRLLSPVEGKENIPLIKTGDTATKSDPEDTNFRPKQQEATVNVESADTFKAMNIAPFIQEVKKRKLDILKEGGLEVTPVRATLQTDSRPSVIQQVTCWPAEVISQSMPPPKNPKTPTSSTFTFANGASPPKVVQSKSIYSYSEKTVYGNPNDFLTPKHKNYLVQAPKFNNSASPRQNGGGDPVDLSVNSPQKPMVDVMRIPTQSSLHRPYNRESVTKNLYKSTVAANSLMEGRRLGPNLEITLVAPNRSSTPNVPKNYVFPPAQLQPSSQHFRPYQQQQHKRAPAECYTPNKMTKTEENTKFAKPFLPRNHNFPVNNRTSTPRSEQKQMQNQTASKHLPNLQPNIPAMFPPYLMQLYEGQKGMPTSPYLPLMDQAVYYSAAIQSLYSNGGLNSAPPPIMSMPTPEQLKFYTELMAHGRYPFQMPQESNPVNNNNLKKP